MKTDRKFISEITADVYATMLDFKEAGLVSDETMAEFDELCFVSTAIDESGKTNPFENLDKEDIQYLVYLTKLNTKFVSYLSKRLIEFKSIPRSFIKEVAEHLGISNKHLTAYLSSEEAASNSQGCFGSDAKEKSTRKITFNEAVMNSGLNKTQIKRMLSYK